MSNITISPNVATTIGTATDTNSNPQTVKPTATPPAPQTPTPPADNVSLSLGAQTVAPTPPTQTLSDSAASAQSVTLRQQLGSAPLSGTARQNQAIVALLR
jgi:hypothetical protein